MSQRKILTEVLNEIANGLAGEISAPAPLVNKQITVRVLLQTLAVPEKITIESFWDEAEAGTPELVTVKSYYSDEEILKKHG